MRLVPHETCSGIVRTWDAIVTLSEIRLCAIDIPSNHGQPHKPIGLIEFTKTIYIRSTTHSVTLYQSRSYRGARVRTSTAIASTSTTLVALKVEHTGHELLRDDLIHHRPPGGSELLRV